MFIARIAAVAAVLVLAACRYESTTDLRETMTAYKVTQVFPEGDYTFVSVDGKQLLELEVVTETARGKVQIEGSSPDSDTFIAVLGSSQLPQSTYLAMALGSNTDDGRQIYRYYPFQFSQSHVDWYRPGSVVEVSGLGDLAPKVAEAFGRRGETVYEKVPAGAVAGLRERFAQMRKEQAQKSAGSNSSSSAAPPAAVAAQPQAAPTVNGYSVGDGVFVQGFLNDETGVIQEIDTANDRVKVLRWSDGTSAWVASDRIISRGKAQANDVGRGVAALGLAVCLFNPDACAAKP